MIKQFTRYLPLSLFFIQAPLVASVDLSGQIRVDLINHSATDLHEQGFGEEVFAFGDQVTSRFSLSRARLIVNSDLKEGLKFQGQFDCAGHTTVDTASLSIAFDGQSAKISQATLLYSPKQEYTLSVGLDSHLALRAETNYEPFIRNTLLERAKFLDAFSLYKGVGEKDLGASFATDYDMWGAKIGIGIRNRLSDELAQELGFVEDSDRGLPLSFGLRLYGHQHHELLEGALVLGYLRRDNFLKEPVEPPEPEKTPIFDKVSLFYCQASALYDRFAAQASYTLQEEQAYQDAYVRYLTAHLSYLLLGERYHLYQGDIQAPSFNERALELGVRYNFSGFHNQAGQLLTADQEEGDKISCRNFSVFSRYCFNEKTSLLLEYYTSHLKIADVLNPVISGELGRALSLRVEANF